MRHIFVCLLFILTYPLAARAQQQPYLFFHLGIREGLASQDVTAVQQDKQGFIWIATIDGLQRFDGERFLTFKHNEADSTTLPDDRIIQMKYDGDQRLWMVFQDNSAGYFTTTGFLFRSVPVDDGYSKPARQAGLLFKDSQHNIYLLLRKNKLLTYSPRTGSFSETNNKFTLPPGWHPLWMSQDEKEGNYWVGCDSGLYKYNSRLSTTSWAAHNTDKDAIISAFRNLKDVYLPYLDTYGTFWLASWPEGGQPKFGSYNTKTGTVQQWMPQVSTLVNDIYREILNIYETSDSTLWISGLEIFARFNRRQQQFELLPDNQPGEFSLRYDVVKNLFEDREHNLWVSTNKGLFRFNPSSQLFTSISNKRSPYGKPSESEVTDILQTKNGNILAGTWGTGLYAFDSSFQPINPPYIEKAQALGQSMVWSLYEHPNGDIWCGHQQGYLYWINARSGVVKKLQLPVFENSTIRQITADRQGNIWLGTQNGLLVKWDAVTETFTVQQRLQSAILRLYADNAGRLWAGTFMNGLFAINSRNGKVLMHITADGEHGATLQANTVMDIVQYSNDKLFIAAGGLQELNLNNNRVTALVPQNKDITHNITNLVADNDGTLWISTKSRLFGYDVASGIAVEYREEQGIAGSEFEVAAATTLRDGRIAIGRAHDWLIFDPKTINRKDDTPPEVAITGLLVMNQPRRVPSADSERVIELPYNQNMITIQFSTLTYQNLYTVHYKLEGIDKDWQQAKRNEVVYGYLPPGDYTFLLFSKNRKDIAGTSITKLRFSIAAPFWKTYWFFGLLLLMVIFLLYWADNVRRKRKLQLFRMRSVISDNLNQEIADALQDINVLSEIARLKATSEPAQSVSYINEIHHKSKAMIRAMDDMLWSIDPQNDSMLTLIERAKEFAAILSHYHNATIRIQNDKLAGALKPEMNVRHELVLILKLALRTLVEELRSKEIRVDFSFINKVLQMNIVAQIPADGATQYPILKAEEEMKRRAAAIGAAIGVTSDSSSVAIAFALP